MSGTEPSGYNPLKALVLSDCRRLWPVELKEKGKVHN